MHTSTDIPPAPASTGKRSFFINRNFGLLWSGQTISEFGSRITREGLPLAANLVLRATPVQMGLLAAIVAVRLRASPALILVAAALTTAIGRLIYAQATGKMS